MTRVMRGLLARGGAQMADARQRFHHKALMRLLELWRQMPRHWLMGKLIITGYNATVIAIHT